MKLTRRGRTVAGGIVLGFLWASIFGIHAMNAVLLPGVVALVAGWWMVRYADETRVRREPIEPGFPGHPREVTVIVSAPSSLSATVIDRLPINARPVGESAAGTERGDPPSTSTGSGTYRTAHRVVDGRATFEIAVDRRGADTLGPLEVRLTDPFGLFVETIRSDESVELLTYPTLRELVGLHGRPDLLPGGGTRPDRHEFDRLREYEQGDAPRDIDWKSSAKRGADPLIVKEFVSATAAGDLVIVAESDPDDADGMAQAAASLARRLLHDGIAVGLETSDQTIPVGSEGTQERRLLTALARTRGGPVDANVRDGASVTIRANGSDIRVRLGSDELSFDALTEDARDRDARLVHAIADGGWNQ